MPTLSPPEIASIKMEHLRLLHHFDNFTSRTFVMDSQDWKNAVIKLALQVMHFALRNLYPASKVPAHRKL